MLRRPSGARSTLRARGFERGDGDAKEAGGECQRADDRARLVQLTAFDAADVLPGKGDDAFATPALADSVNELHRRNDNAQRAILTDRGDRAIHVLDARAEKAGKLGCALAGEMVGRIAERLFRWGGSAGEEIEKFACDPPGTRAT